MEENWISVRYGDKCIVSFNYDGIHCVDVELDVEDVAFLNKKLDGFLLGKCLIESV